MIEQNTRFEIIKKYNNREYSRKEAAALLGLSERQISRLKLQYLDGTLLPTPAQENANTAKRSLILTKKRTKPYQNMNISQYQRALKEDFSIEISYSALYNILKENHIESPLKQNRMLLSPAFRIREKASGALLHIFSIPAENDFSHIFLLDDATGKMLAYRFLVRFNCFSCFALLYEGFSKFGLPKRLCIHLPSTKHTTSFSDTMKLSMKELDIVYEEENENPRTSYLKNTLEIYLNTYGCASSRFLTNYNKKYSIRASYASIFRTSPSEATLKMALSYQRPWHMNTSGRFLINNRNYIIQHDYLSAPPAGSFIMLHIHNPSVIYAVYRSKLYTATSEPKQRKNA